MDEELGRQQADSTLSCIERFWVYPSDGATLLVTISFDEEN